MIARPYRRALWRLRLGCAAAAILLSGHTLIVAWLMIRFDGPGWIGGLLPAVTAFVLLFLLLGVAAQPRPVGTFFEPRIEERLRPGSRRTLLRQGEELDGLARLAGVRPLSQFVSENIQLRPVLHDAAEGLRTVDALLAALASRGVRFKDPPAVHDALTDLRDTLATGVVSGARFCLFHG